MTTTTAPDTILSNLLPMSQATAAYGVSRWTLHKRVQSGHLPSALLPGIRLVPKPDTEITQAALDHVPATYMSTNEARQQLGWAFRPAFDQLLTHHAIAVFTVGENVHLMRRADLDRLPRNPAKGSRHKFRTQMVFPIEAALSQETGKMWQQLRATGRHQREIIMHGIALLEEYDLDAIQPAIDTYQPGFNGGRAHQIRTAPIELTSCDACRYDAQRQRLGLAQHSRMIDLCIRLVAQTIDK